MEQRRLRVGDIVDDYCPRERRVTNHAVVAMIDDAIRQTRCTTCDAEHPFKGGAAPRRRRNKETPDALYNEVLSGMADKSPGPPADDEPPAPADPLEPKSEPEEGPVRRPLIRATLPRSDGTPKERPTPEFTIRQPGMRGGFRDGRRAGGSGRPQGNGQRFGGRSPNTPQRFDRQQRPHGHQKKRSR